LASDNSIFFDNAETQEDNIKTEFNDILYNVYTENTMERKNEFPI